MKIAITAYSIHGKTGAGRIIRQHAHYFASLGWDVEILAHKVKYFETPERVRVRRTPFWFIRDKKRRDRFYDWIKKETSLNAYDLTIGHNHPYGDLYFVHNLSKRVLSELKGKEVDYPDCSRWACRGIIANSQMVRNDLIAHYRADPEKIELLLPGLNPALFSQDAQKYRAGFRKTHKIPEDAFVVGLISSGDLEKRGFPAFLKIAEGLKAPIEKLWLLVVGNDLRPHRIRASLRRTMQSERFTYIPTTTQIETVFGSVDVMLHPAAYEEFGMVIAEALACATPVVTDACVGASSLITTEDETLVAASMRDIDTMRDAVLRIHSDPARYQALFRKLSHQVLEDLTWEKHCDRLGQTIFLFQGRARPATPPTEG